MSSATDVNAQHDGASSTADWNKYTNRSYPWQRAVTPFHRLVEHEYDGKGTEESPYLVHWLPHDDPENPMTWGEYSRWGLAIFVSVSTLAVALASSAYSGAVDSIGAELGGSEEVLILGVSMFVLGFAIGPLFWAPLSEMFGRRNLFLMSYTMMTLWQAVSVASPNIGALIVFRFLAGAFGSSPLTNAGGTIADCFKADERGLAMAVFASAPFLGPSLGPITGGFLGESAGWKWVIGFLAIFSGTILIIGFFLMSETYAPVLLRARAKKLSKATGKHYLSALDVGKDTSLKAQFAVALSRPWQLLVREPIVLVLSIYIAIVYGILYSFFAAFPLVFQTLRGWSPGLGGLAFLGVLVGMLTGIGYIVVYENPRYVRETAKANGKMLPPEQRLGPSMIGSVLLVIGLAIFTGTNGPSVHWIAPIIAGAPFGAGMVLVFLSVMNYLIDAYLLYAASVLAANSVIRSVFGAAFPLFTNYMYQPVGCPLATCGVHVGAGIALALAVLCVPAPFVFNKYGPTIRSKCKFAAEAAALMDKMNREAEQEGEGHDEKNKEKSGEKAPRDEEEAVETDRTAASSPHRERSHGSGRDSESDAATMGEEGSSGISGKKNNKAGAADAA
ncbi:putative mfs-multidrug-resistance transporter [Microstroma glucosiphilum]|uniref:Putative mfs-multidrug-resistance transporter n=1 Tax=Pseudomicrostroma glucosiphilum TaxID=1684307 RepID=A0A316UE73_9BASI|nr:putative mfs-multidrug-resistance transporter [Pseudomicrostroma glucosiphilum]PWN23510.1 putative mfs-multidrug-resistance transporter [Pseudomicrostroma glucosiphilum]